MYNFVQSLTIEAGQSNASAISAAGSTIAGAIHNGFEKNSKAIKLAGEAIGKSNMQIAENMLQSSKAILKGLSCISDELERKRYTDEYYLLMEKIDELEDKIIGLGVDVLQIYSTLEVATESTVNISATDIRVLSHVFCTEEHRAYLENAIMAFDCAPFNLLLDLARDSYYCVVRDYISKPKISMHCEALGEVILQFDSDMCRYFVSILKREQADEEELGSETRYTKRYSDSDFGDWVFAYSDHLEDNPRYASTPEQLENFNQLTAFISGINSKIMVGNLRNLYTSLHDEYKKLKYDKRKQIS